MNQIPADPDVDSLARRPHVLRVHARSIVAVFAGGMVGTTLRWLMGLALPAQAALFAVNTAGALALGLLLGWLSKRPDERGWRLLRLFLGTGVLGSFTTYSALAVVPVLAPTLASVGFVTASVGSGILATALGWWWGSR